jgi:hypothetical protein
MVSSHQLLANPLRVFSRPSIASLLSRHRERPTRPGLASEIERARATGLKAWISLLRQHPLGVGTVSIKGVYAVVRGGHIDDIVHSPGDIHSAKDSGCPTTKPSTGKVANFPKLALLTLSGVRAVSPIGGFTALLRFLHSRRCLIRAFIVQRNPHSALRIHPSSCAPVDVIRADDTASTARQGVGNAPVLIAITTH